jgi:SNF2 family DNA or RNA helicase
MAMGTGKSKVAIDLLAAWQCSRVLVLCPVSVRNVWRREFRKWSKDQWPVVVLETGTVTKKKETAKTIWDDVKQMILVINYESAWRDPLGTWILCQDWDCVILDESHRVKAHNTAISRFVMRLASRAKRRLCLTGTPMPHSPLDVFGQYRFLDWRLFGKRWVAFRASYAKRDNPSIPQQITGFQNLDRLQERFGRLAFQVGPEVMDLPPVTHDTRTFQLTGMAARIYRDLERDFLAEVEGGIVTAANVLVKTLRLRQVVSGFVQADDTETLTEVHDGKAVLLADLLEDLGQPCVVFAEFRYDLKMIRKTAEKLGLAYGEVSGRANDLTDDATIPPGIDVLGVQYQSGGLGVDLSAVQYGIYFSPTWSLGNYEQSLARIHRPGQTGHVHYYHLVAENTVDELVYKSLEKKRNIIDGILAVIRGRQLLHAGAEPEAILDEIERTHEAIVKLEELESPLSD